MEHLKTDGINSDYRNSLTPEQLMREQRQTRADIMRSTRAVDPQAVLRSGGHLLTRNGSGATLGPDGKFHMVRHYSKGHIGHERSQRALPSGYGTQPTHAMTSRHMHAHIFSPGASVIVT